MFQARYRYIYILILAAYSFLNIKFTESDALFDFEIGDWVLALFISVFTIGIWEVNRWLYGIVDRYIPKKRLFGPLITFFLFSLVGIFLLSLLGSILAPMMFEVPANSAIFRLMLGFNFRVNLFLHCINAILFYRKQVNNFQLEAERFKKQSAEAQFDALRNQVNPHFLFNSLNVLSNLVYKNSDMAAEFIAQLSQVYRYLLKNKDNNLVKLEEELNFLKAYIYLMQIRFQDNLKIENKIEVASRKKYIAPAALQLLIENAIKHNEVSRQAPLNITVYNENGHLVVENNIQLKEHKEESSHVGLNNIRNRYAFLSSENPVIVHANGKFTVKIPLIEVEE